MTGWPSSEPADPRDAAMMGESSHLATDDGRDTGAREHQQVRPINWLSRLVARVPVRIRTMFLVSLAVMVLVLVFIGGLGLRVLGESNARFGTLATLQQNAATYRALQEQNSTLKSTLAARASLFPPVAAPTNDDVEKTLRQSGASYELRGRVRVTGGEERKLVARIESDYTQFAAVMTNAIQLDR